jgi:hypothetical protein
MLGLLWEFQNDTEFFSLENLANSAARRKPVSLICFATFIQQKITKLMTRQQTLMLESTDLESLDVKKSFDVYFTIFKRTKFYPIKLATDF